MVIVLVIYAYSQDQLSPWNAVYTGLQSCISIEKQEQYDNNNDYQLT